MPRIVLVFAFLLASFPTLSQTQPNGSATPPFNTNPFAGLKSVDDLEHVLEKDRLKTCEADLRNWNDWWAKNKHAIDEYLKEQGQYQHLAQRTQEEEDNRFMMGYFCLGGGIVMSLALVWGIVVMGKRLFQSRPFTAAKKQLVA
jgi:hypothetical protein